MSKRFSAIPWDAVLVIILGALVGLIISLKFVK
jgi:hypothetical protein